MLINKISEFSSERNKETRKKYILYLNVNVPILFLAFKFYLIITRLGMPENLSLVHWCYRQIHKVTVLFINNISMDE